MFFAHVNIHVNIYVILFLFSLFPRSVLIDSNSDAFNIMNAGLLHGDGCCLISGTGSSCFVRRGDIYTQIGGWEYLIDKQGSGFDIGHDCIGAVLKAHDGRGQKTLLSDLAVYVAVNTPFTSANT